MRPVRTDKEATSQHRTVLSSALLLSEVLREVEFQTWFDKSKLARRIRLNLLRMQRARVGEAVEVKGRATFLFKEVCARLFQYVNGSSEFRLERWPSSSDLSNLREAVSEIWREPHLLFTRLRGDRHPEEAN